MAINWAPSTPSPGGRLGQALGTGLGSGLQALADYKIKEMQEEQQIRKQSPFWEARGRTPEEARAISRQSPQMQAQILKQEEVNKTLGPVLSELQELFGINERKKDEIAPSQRDVISPQEERFLPGQQESPSEILQKAISGEGAFEKLKKETQLPFYASKTLDTARDISEQTFTPRKEEAFLPSQQAFKKPLSQDEAVQISSAIASKDAKAISKAVRDIFKERKKEEAAEKKALTEEEKRKKEEAFEMYKMSGPQRKEIKDNAQRARDELHDLDRMGELQEEGKLDSPGYVEFLKRSGLDIPALMHEGSEEFNKLRQSFLRNMKTYFGSRVSNQEMEQFLKGIPDLSQSAEGRKRVIAGMKRISRGKLVMEDEYMDLLRENKWNLPLYWEEQLQQKVSKKLDKVAEQFKADLKKPVPKGQNKFILGLQAALGSVVGAPGALLGKLGSIGGAGGAAEVLI